jgi:hypothetical protein
MLIGAWRKGKRCQVGGAISPGHVTRCHFAARWYFLDRARLPNTLTGVGKIYKHLLRREAAQRAFEAAIATLREEGTAAVTVRDDPSHGMLAAVQVSAPAGASREAIVKRCGELLGGFQIRHAVDFPDALRDRSRSAASRRRHAISHSGMPARRKPSRNLSEPWP